MNNNCTSNHLLCVGKVTAAHALKGAIKIYPYSETEGIFVPGNQILLRDHCEKDKSYRIKSVKQGNRVLFLTLENVSRREHAEELKGKEIFISKKYLPPLSEGTFYWHELIGMEVVDKQLGRIGKLVKIISTGSNDVYVVRSQEKETLVPATINVVLSVDTEKAKMEVNLPEGL